MTWYAETSSKRTAQQLGDAAVAAWTLLWLWIGNAVHDAVRQLAAPGRELEEAGFGPGSSVIVERTATGEVLLIPESRVRARIRAIGRKAIEENREALRMLEEYDRGDIPGE